MADWNSTQYLKFERERTQPSIDLASRIPGTPEKIIDIGCGPGNSTVTLAKRFPNASVLGVDNSQNMIEKANASYPELQFALCDISAETGTLDHDFDLVFSNACLQWVPEHETLLPKLLGLLKPGGTLAVQIPNNSESPVHQIAQRLSVSEKWAPFIPSPRVFHSLTPGGYFDLFSKAASDFTIWETVYYHVMDSHQGIIEWYRGTGLRPYLDALPEEKRGEFEQEVYDEVVRAYPVQENGKIIFRFPRLFFTATP